MIVCRNEFSRATSLPARKRSEWVAWRIRSWPRGSMTISLAPRLAACLKKVAATGWLVVGRAPMTMMHSAFERVGERRRHRARADALHQGGDRGGVAEPGAMVDIVGAEALAHQLLEQVGLLVGALGRAEAGQRPPAMLRRGSSSGRWRRAPAPPPRWLRGRRVSGSTPRRSACRPTSAHRRGGSAAWSAARATSHSRSRSGP